ncbi:phage holin family protein [Gloeobacter morelensis]|uniref:Phage holin family protein n=1 Tax=Gloeobacter morelensis MG652769 TaxID=2781736 RepID=A0ABY3PGS4_9CYAN|nr:phage holin family protein [Gloeobacter morelensis]UFP92872.1 phage holin family protein [Gloeobacter morelensis MG652769]
MITFLLSWLVSAAVLVLVSYIVPGFTVSTIGAAFIAALVVGIINAIIVPVLNLLALPINILTLGLFSFVISALGLLLAAAIVPGFAIAGFWTALLGAILIAVANAAVGLLGGRSFA